MSSEDEKLQPGDEFSFTTEEIDSACFPDIEFGDGVSAVLKSLSDTSPRSYNRSSILTYGQDSVDNEKQLDSAFHLAMLREKDIALAEQAREMQKKDNIIAALVTSEKLAISLSKQNEAMVKSLLALVNKERKVKLVLWNHQVTYKQVVPTEEVRDEMAMAATRNREIEKQKEQAYISQLSKVVDRLAQKYGGGDRYENISTIIDCSQPRFTCDPSHLPKAVPKEMLAMWLYQVEPSKEEEEKYDQYLCGQLRPPPVHSPCLPRPYVNWNKLNPFQHKNLPAPQSFPVLGCSPNPSFYATTMPDPEKYMGVQVPIWGRVPNPFGSLYGFNTNMGVVAVPNQPIHGYRCSASSGIWMIDARG